ncbi:hypothetical protein EKO04_007347 [Ascochyta lentis]|uniref:Uncharacterized protein n=1 Tax=Ascochyta lentis TaxID=205686 RepID=A0A8H7MH33_9PLEO|nr:hypothetical protein EKO04_007347 [Ascochyta lentis]
MKSSLFIVGVLSLMLGATASPAGLESRQKAPGVGDKNADQLASDSWDGSEATCSANFTSTAPLITTSHVANATRIAALSLLARAVAAQENKWGTLWLVIAWYR